MKTDLRFRCGVLSVALLCAGLFPAYGATTTINWDGNGVSGGTGSAFWDNNTSGNWNAGSGANANFNSATTTLDFGGIAVGGSYTFGTAASTVQTINAYDITFADANTAVTTATTASTITLNGDNNGVAQTTNDVTLSLADNILVGPPGVAAGTGQLAILGSDITLSLTSGAHTIGTFASGFFSGTTNPLSTSTVAGSSALLVNSRITNAGFTSSIIQFGSSGAFGSGGGTSDRVATILTNDNNSFDAPVKIAGSTFYTSISNINGGNSALGAPSSAASTLTLSNSAYFGYIGTANQTVTRNIIYGASSALLNDSAAGTPTTIEFQSLTNNQAASGQLRLDSANAGDVLKISAALADYDTAGNKLLTLAIGGQAYYDNLGVYHASASLGSVLLTGANTFTGGVQLSAGTLQIGNVSALGTGLLTWSGGKLDNLTGSAFTLGGNTIKLSGTIGFVGTNDLNLGSGAVTLLNTTLTPSAGTLEIDGVISGGASLTLATGNGTVVLGGANTYSNGTTLQVGTETLALKNAAALGTGTVTILGGKLDNASGGALTLTTNNAQSWTNGFIFAGTNNLNMGTGTVTLAGNVIVNALSHTLTVGALSASGKALTKQGSGTLIVNGGTVNGVTVSAGTFGSTGTLTSTSNITVASGAILLAGDGASASTLTLSSNLAMSSGSILEFYLSSPTVSSLLARSSGTWSFASTQQVEFLNLQAGTYQLMSGLASDPGSEANWSLFAGTGYSAVFSYSANSIYATVSAVPEPATWALLAGGAVALYFFSRRARQSVRA